MKKSIYVPLVQSSPKWHLFRAQGVGASEASILAGENPFKTIQELWKDKVATYYTSQTKPDEMNSFMKNGVELEGKAREEFTKATGLVVEPKCFIHPNPKLSFVRSSLDGITADHKIILEIKCPGRPGIHQKVIKTGEVPSYYFAQLQYQLMTVPEAEVSLYWSYMKSMGGFMLEVRPDPVYQKILLRRVKSFWQSILTKTPPDPKKFTSIR